jgi:hypothetical protein
MKGRVIDKGLEEAFIALESGITIDVSLSRLPKNVKIGETVEVPNENHSLANDKLVGFF